VLESKGVTPPLSALLRAPADAEDALHGAFNAFHMPLSHMDGPFGDAARKLGIVDSRSTAGLLHGGRRSTAASTDTSSSILTHTTTATTSSIISCLWPVHKVEYSATTNDGVRLHATRARCPAASSALGPRCFPVMLVPGLASSSEATWDVTPELSLMDCLARQGYDVWAVDLRGAKVYYVAAATSLGKEGALWWGSTVICCRLAAHDASCSPPFIHAAAPI